MTGQDQKNNGGQRGYRNRRGRGRRNNQNNGNNQRNRNRNNNGEVLPELAPPPLVYNAKPDKQIRQKIEWRRANTKSCEKLPIYDDTTAKDYIRTVRAFLNLKRDYVYLGQDTGAAIAAQVFRKCLQGSALNSFLEAIDALGPNGVTTIAELETAMNSTTEEVLGHDAFENQMEYLKRTKKPKKMSVDDWMRRIRNINFSIPVIDSSQTALTDNVLIRDVILPNVPALIKLRLKSNGAVTLPWSQIKMMLTNMYAELELEANRKNTSRSNGRGNRRRGNGNGNGRNNNSGSDGKGKNGRKRDGQENYRNERSQRSKTNEEDTSASDSYNSDAEEANMMARLKQQPRDDTQKAAAKARSTSCAILVSVETPQGRRSFLGLIDTGTSASLANRDVVQSCKANEKKRLTDWSTQGGEFTTTHEAEITDIKLPQFTKNRKVNFEMCLFKKKANDRYDFILGCDFQQAVGIDILNSSQQLAWDGVEVAMLSRKEAKHLAKSAHSGAEEAHLIQKGQKEAIKEAKYEKADPKEVAAAQTHLTGLQREAFLQFLVNKEAASQGCRGTWNGDPVEFDLKPGARPFAMRPYQIPHAHMKVTKAEVDRLEKEVGLLTKTTGLKYLSACFVIPKKDGTVRFITDFRRLNQMVVRTPFPLPNIQETLSTLGNFKWATVIDLVMGYYHMPLSDKVRQYCGIVLPWGTNVYNFLPMGLCVATDVFQARLGELFLDMKNVLIYIDDILVVSHGTFEEHLNILHEVLDRLIKKGMQVNMRKCEWFRNEVEYLGYLIGQDGIRPQKRKVEKILAISTPRTPTELRGFLGMVNYYRYMWKQRSTLIAPLSEIASRKNKKLEWTPRHQDVFDKIKRVIAKEALLVYPDFRIPFEVHTDSSDYQLGGVVSQRGKPIGFFSRKLNSAQKNYPTIEKELLGIAETLKEFRYILLGHKIIIWTDHQNLCSPKTVHECQRVMRQRLLLEEYGAEIRHIAGTSNVVADAISRLNYEPEEARKLENYSVHELESVNDFDVLQLPYIARVQSENKDEFAKYERRTEPCGTRLFVHKDRIVVPRTLRNTMMQWYHESLLHPGMNRMKATIKSNFYWKGMDTDIENLVRNCDKCQIFKKTAVRPVGHVPVRASRSVTPWDRVHVDCVGPWTVDIRIQDSDKVVKRTILALTMICEATLWPEIALVQNTKSWHVAHVFDSTWLCRYPRPKAVVFDNGGEFIGVEFEELLESYNVKGVPTTVRNPQANGCIERMHLTAADMLRTMSLEAETECPIRINDTLNTACQAVAWGLRTTVSTVTSMSPGVVVFSRDMIFNFKFRANWDAIEKKRDKLAMVGAERENSKRIPYEYSVGEKVLIVRKKYERVRKIGDAPTEGPFVILQINGKGTVVIQRSKYKETINVRRLKPFREENNNGKDRINDKEMNA